MSGLISRLLVRVRIGGVWSHISSACAGPYQTASHECVWRVSGQETGLVGYNFVFGHCPDTLTGNALINGRLSYTSACFITDSNLARSLLIFDFADSGVVDLEFRRLLAALESVMKHAYVGLCRN